MPLARLATCLTLVPLIVLSSGAAVWAQGSLPEQVSAANSRFKDVAVATSEGYAPIPCASSVDGGAMGIHYVNKEYLGDDAPLHLEPMADGKLALVAVEYISLKGPASLDGQLFSFTNTPNRYGLPAFYELHVWAWKDNPKGPFTDNNPDVSCEHAH